MVQPRVQEVPKGGMPKRVPTEKPDFTIGTLRKAIPAHCWERSLTKSFGYLFADLLIAAALTYASTWIEHPAVPGWAVWPLWGAYWFAQGAVCTGLWVVAHECGHGAFSAKTWINDLVGFIVHSCLLVPYYSWKHSHRRHHSNTGSVAKDEVFVPPMGEPHPLIAWVRMSPLYRVGHLLFQQLLGWPSYLLFNASGRPYDRWANHFDPYSPIYSKRERVEVLLSDLGVLAVCVGLHHLRLAFGGAWLVKTYLVPYFIVNFWLVMITYLQHTHPSLPHYDDKEWDWLRGALATVDRSYGLLDVAFHHIADTHVCHHLFSSLPHYHAQEATEALKPLLGAYYACDERNVFRALWDDTTTCFFVAPEEEGSGVLWFRDSYWFSTTRAAAAKAVKAQ